MITTKLTHRSVVALLLFAPVNAFAQSPLENVLTYQAQLEQSGQAFNGAANLVFRLFDVPAGGTALGSQSLPSTPVTNGLFTVQLNGGGEFGANAFNGEARWLEVEVNGTPLSPRQPMTPAPSALCLPGLYTVQTNVSPNLIGGYSGNLIASGVIGATIGGGGAAGFENVVGGNFAAVGGGGGNAALAPCSVADGCNNVVAALADYATISGGGPLNPLDPQTGNRVDSPYGTIGGGGGNFVGTNPPKGPGTAHYGVIAGGAANLVSNDHAAVGGGNTNAASGRYSVVAGGQGNSAGGQWSSVGGGSNNSATAQCATVPGGVENSATGAFSFAAGSRAKANHRGAFVWGDSSLADFQSTGTDQFLIRATGGVGIGTDAPAAGAKLDVAGMVRMTSLKMPGGAVGKVLVSDAVGVGTWQDPPGGSWTANGNDIFNANVGNVGVGTNTPAQKLDVSGLVQMTGFKMPTGAADGKILVSDAAGVGTWQVPSGGGGPWQVSGSDIYYNAGHVGIGSANPVQASLEVAGGIVARGGPPGANGVNNNGYAFWGNSGDDDSGMFSSADGLLQFFTNANERLRISASGNVGIGTTAPTKRLHVGGTAEVTGAATFGSTGTFSGSVGVGTSATASYPLSVAGAVVSAVAAFDRTGSDGVVVAIRQDGGVEGTISVSGNTVSYNAFTGSHYAWADSAIERGTLVCMTGHNRRYRGDPDSEIVYGVAPCASANDSRCLGAYLGLQEPTRAPSDANPHLVMAVGNGEMRVIDTGRPIRPGDLLISSDMPGCAMLDDPERFRVAHIVARAAEGVDWSDVPASVRACKETRISVLFERFARSDEARHLAQLVGDQQRQIDELKRAVLALHATTNADVARR